MTIGRIYTNGLDYGIRKVDNHGIDVITPDNQILVMGAPSLPEAVRIAQTDSKDPKYDYLRDPYRRNKIFWPEA